MWRDHVASAIGNCFKQNQRIENGVLGRQENHSPLERHTQMPKRIRSAVRFERQTKVLRRRQ